MIALLVTVNVLLQGGHDLNDFILWCHANYDISWFFQIDQSHVRDVNYHWRMRKRILKPWTVTGTNPASSE